MSPPAAAAQAAAPAAATPRPAPQPPNGGDRRRLHLLPARLLLAFTWVALGKLLGLWLSQLPVLSLLGTTSVTFVSAAVLFGWGGVVVGMGVQLAYLWLLQGLAGPYPWASAAAYGAAGALAWMAFRYLPRLGRGLSDGRSLAWLVAAGALGSVLSATVISSLGHAGDVWLDIAVWSRSTTVSVLVFTPALLVLGEGLLRRGLAPIPGELSVGPPRRVALVREVAPSYPAPRASGEGPGGAPALPPAEPTQLQVVDVQTRVLSPWRVVGLGALMVAAITGCKLLLANTQGHDYVWWNLLYMLPIWWMAQGWRLPGAMVGVGMVSAAALGSDAALAASANLSEELALAIYARLLVFFLVGALLGRGAEREGRLLEGLADHHRRLSQDLQRVVKALTGAVEAKDAYTEGHLQRVNAYALEVGRRLGLGAHELELLQIASTLHDIGKIGIPEAILNKPGPLSAEERQVMQRHPEIGARLLARIDGLREAAPLVLHHQERWDGRTGGDFPGYPGALAGEAIPLGARIIAVVDAFDAMTTDRPYRAALAAAAARQTLLAERARQFDPRVVDTFLAVLDERPWS